MTFRPENPRIRPLISGNLHSAWDAGRAFARVEIELKLGREIALPLQSAEKMPAWLSDGESQEWHAQGRAESIDRPDGLVCCVGKTDNSAH